MLKKICVFGDSVSSGVVSNPVTKKFEHLNENFVSLYSNATGVETNNYAKMGCTVVKGLEIVKKRLERIAQCDSVFVEFGGNDSDVHWDYVEKGVNSQELALTPYNLFVTTYEQMVGQLLQMGKNVIVATLPPIVHERYFEWVCHGRTRDKIMSFCKGSPHYLYRRQERYSLAVENLARRMNIPLIDIRSIFLGIQDYEEYMCIDGIHPNAKGHRLIFDYLQSHPLRE